MFVNYLSARECLALIVEEEEEDRLIQLDGLLQAHAEIMKDIARFQERVKSANFLTADQKHLAVTDAAACASDYDLGIKDTVLCCAHLAADPALIAEIRGLEV